MWIRRAITVAAVGALCGLAAGVAAGVGGRVAMRMVADGVVDVVRATPAFTPGGSLVVLFTAVAVAAPLGVVYVLVADRLPGPHRLRGPVFGLLLLALIGPFFLRTEEFFSTGRVLLFAALFPIVGLVFGAAHGPSRALAARLPIGPRAALALVPVASGTLIVVAVVLAVLGLPAGFVM